MAMGSNRAQPARTRGRQDGDVGTGGVSKGMWPARLVWGLATRGQVFNSGSLLAVTVTIPGTSICSRPPTARSHTTCPYGFCDVYRAVPARENL